ncbi:MAG: bifunctional 5,10-methylenetetrahydrofolate dehydrogenase/5,10-methenyltetrahydrofolate cyclohydrolase [Acidaminococcaceae bacterium]|nr:bifunctional 5,10-methylenetetrahydrofolate dehydrogenase/5,10-methenyltetrahydrofolate cyclohydrolase [Acidaminococcaceae bacterium]
MDTLLMKGKPVADAARQEIAAKIERAGKEGRQVTLAIVTVGDDSASHVYKERLCKTAEGLGVTVRTVGLAGNAAQQEVEETIKSLNADSAVTGILLMMPLPPHLNGDVIGALIAPEKDVDCLNPLNAGELYLGRSRWAPCTPRACLAVLRHYGIELKGRHVVVLGRSNVVGKPVALLLLQEHATVTVCHSRTADLPSFLRQADIIVAAVGIPAFVKPDMVKQGVVVIDVGINSEGGRLLGDVDEAVAAKASAFTPVPGGIGVVSNMMVMDMLSRNL